ncbi:Pentatricopeptide repeat [Arabidopsis suecica]|uniref:Pentatricopeptide repeat n=1 Tax=Arabidopsis suecica TaxID=45249 RepID=A0A8T2BSM7_ARASU|nr:Pentatricopeptide repeat [Arabidopsis suecica]
MISGFCRKGLKEEADALFNKMKENPNSGTYNTLIKVRLRDGDTVLSAELIKEMRSYRYVGDASTKILVTDMLHDGRLDKRFLDMLLKTVSLSSREEEWQSIHLSFKATVRAATKDDPEWLKEQRRQEISEIEKWISEHYTDLRQEEQAK